MRKANVTLTCLCLEKFVRPMMRNRRERPLGGEEAERDLPTIVMTLKDEDGTEFSDDIIEVRVLGSFLITLPSRY